MRLNCSFKGDTRKVRPVSSQYARAEVHCICDGCGYKPYTRGALFTNNACMAVLVDKTNNGKAVCIWPTTLLLVTSKCYLRAAANINGVMQFL